MDFVSCTQVIRSKYDSLTFAEKKIADQILSNPHDSINMSINSLSSCASTAKSAVVRFCKSLGYSGYTQFKLSLAAELSKNKQLNYVPYIDPDDSSEKIMETVFSANVKALHDAAAQLDYSLLDQVLQRLGAARQICLYGVGTSASMVTELQYRLMQLGFNAFAYTDPGTMKISTMNMNQQDVAFAISYSGRTVATVQTIELARQANASTICLTSFPDSPLARKSDYPICIYSDEVQYPVEAMSAKIAQLSLIYALTTALSSRNYENTVQRAKKTRELIDSIRLEVST